MFDALLIFLGPPVEESALCVLESLRTFRCFLVLFWGPRPLYHVAIRIMSLHMDVYLDTLRMLDWVHMLDECISMVDACAR